MILQEKVVIDFKEFFKKGQFDFLKIGQTKEWIINNFPDPDFFTEKNDAIYNSPIWRYGNIELHFDKDILFLIYSDYMKELEGGNHLTLKKCFLEDTDNLKLSTVIQYLNSERIDFSKTTTFLPSSLTVALKLDSKVNLGFVVEELEHEKHDDFLKRLKVIDLNECPLFCFSLSR